MEDSTKFRWRICSILPPYFHSKSNRCKSWFHRNHFGDWAISQKWVFSSYFQRTSCFGSMNPFKGCSWWNSYCSNFRSNFLSLWTTSWRGKSDE
jgi:hypothetical protein